MITYLHSFARCVEVLSNHGTDVLLIIIVSANSVVVVGVDLVTNVLVQFLQQCIAFLLRQLCVLLGYLLMLTANHFLTNHTKL